MKQLYTEITSFLTKMLSADSTVSTMRAMGLIACLSATVVAIYGLHIGKDYSGLSMIVGAFLVPAFTGKAMQKKVENDTESK